MWSLQLTLVHSCCSHQRMQEQRRVSTSHMCVTVGCCFPQAGGIQGLMASQLLEALGCFRSCEKLGRQQWRGEKVKAWVSVILFLLPSFAQVLPSFLWTSRQAALSIKMFKEIMIMTKQFWRHYFYYQVLTGKEHYKTSYLLNWSNEKLLLIAHVASGWKKKENAEFADCEYAILKELQAMMYVAASLCLGFN